ncbi:PAS domain S-box-containing protein [Clostridium cavendishii DSM 21758]|uniref:PAS domain S-box-containing protein n=1 Tax=Clostridium cavendishii DSM 21758 TaxID=1121302 RepID=A0A1M6UGP6_9CLOT|nr:SpoIIE family protein phosphatase [Clostridium cavendishii]SHK68340.1 PAS domain S-box-containing protein [Clostridium cavendishii DSM 21758]
MEKFEREHIDKNKDMNEWMHIHEKILKARINNISDMVAICNLDKTIIFCNETLYRYYNKTSDEIHGKKLCEVLNIGQDCNECFHQKAIVTRETQKFQKYIKELNKYMECIYRPILDYSGDPILIVKKLREITEKEFFENKLEKTQEKYEEIFNIFPEPVLIIVDNKIVLANEIASKYYNNVIGKNIHSLVPNYEKVIEKRMEKILKSKKTKTIFDYKVLLDNGRLVDFEVSSSYILYKEKPAILSIMREITKMKSSLGSVAKIQKMALQQQFPLKDKAYMERIYIPAKTVSGDFYNINKIDEDSVIGIIGDVKGKGLTAALNISACNVLFNEAVLNSQEPNTIIDYLNSKIVNYLGDSYIAACCFKLDFKNNRSIVVGAGINEFIFQTNEQYEKKVVRGPFLGMFEDSLFDEIIINFKPKDKFYFFTDGLDFILHDEMEKECYKASNISELKNYLNNFLINMLTELDGLKDDCTLVALEIK